MIEQSGFLLLVSVLCVFVCVVCVHVHSAQEYVRSACLMCVYVSSCDYAFAFLFVHEYCIKGGARSQEMGSAWPSWISLSRSTLRVLTESVG